MFRSVAYVLGQRQDGVIRTKIADLFLLSGYPHKRLAGAIVVFTAGAESGDESFFKQFVNYCFKRPFIGYRELSGSIFFFGISANFSGRSGGSLGYANPERLSANVSRFARGDDLPGVRQGQADNR